MLSSRKVLIFLNPLASKRRQLLLNTLIHELDARGISYTYFETFPDVAKTIDAISASVVDCSEIVVLGGDGTLHQAVNALIGFRLPIGYIPCGTGNDFARGWFANLQLSAVEWVQQALDAQTEVIDVGQAGPRYFINVAGVGFDGELVKRMGNKKFIWPKFSYLLAALRAISGYQAGSFALAGSNAKVMALAQRPGFLLALANNQYFGAGMHIAPHAKVDDGTLAYCFIEKCSWLSRFKILNRVGKGAHASHPKVHCGQLHAVQIKTPNLPVQADGEYIGDTPMIVRTIPAAIQLRRARRVN